MSRKLVAQTTCNTRTGVVIKVYKDTEWGEYIVYFVIDGEKDEPSSYHTCGDSSQDKADALAQMYRFADAAEYLIPLKARTED